MLGASILLFTVIPLIELALLIKIGQIWGLGNTLALVILTGILGAILLKIQGINVLRRISSELNQGMIPSDALFDGFFIFCGGLLLITPGVVTDLLGFLMLFPITRGILKYWVKQKIRKAFEEGRTIHFTHFRKYE
ncbi:MAG: hypothetical protein COX40_00665 [Candidatus Omnitrophica bacterium CG23_combo_of_CG06-09_8_20_14_all_40_11]|nr:MAG: hypothetical protein COX40_00665 [Candidatus Omnitrophica bacterium CG23_combo_of_CG06-09_8_20_14_all_40_11]